MREIGARTRYIPEMRLRRIAAFVLTLVFAAGVFSPVGAACTKGAVAPTSTRSTGHAHHQDAANQPRHSSHHKAPCTSHDSDCCAVMASCANMVFVGTGDRPVAQTALVQPRYPAGLFAPATTPDGVDPPPPRA